MQKLLDLMLSLRAALAARRAMSAADRLIARLDREKTQDTARRRHDVIAAHISNTTRIGHR
jgi:hypothetical protein